MESDNNLPWSEPVMTLSDNLNPLKIYEHLVKIVPRDEALALVREYEMEFKKLGIYKIIYPSE